MMLVRLGAWNNPTLQVVTFKDMEKDNLLAHGEENRNLHQSQ
jgi:hypothetical protein